MKKIERFNHLGDSHVNGEYCLYSDVEKMEKKLGR